MLLTSLESATHTLYQFILPEETFINILPSPKNGHSSRTAAQLITSLWLNLLSFHAFFSASPRPAIKRAQQCGSTIKDIASVPLAALSVYQTERERKKKNQIKEKTVYKRWKEMEKEMKGDVLCKTCVEHSWQRFLNTSLVTFHIRNDESEQEW